MKKLLTITVLIALAMSGFAQNQYDFSAVCESGQTLYYRITDSDAHTVILTHPYREGNPGFYGDYYQGFVKPEGEITACSAGDLGLIPGLGRSPGGGHGNPLQYFAWRTPWTEEPGRLQSMKSQTVRHD